MGHTLRAMKRVNEIQQKRQDMFFQMRMRAHKATQREQIRAEIKKGIDLLAPAGANREIAIGNATKNAVERRRKQQEKMEV